MTNFKKLEELLESKQWKEANDETSNIMLSAVNQKSNIQEYDLDNFPCDALQKIDKLWIHYGDGRFGFTIQNYIFQELKKEHKRPYIKFCQKVGWRDKQGALVHPEYPDGTETLAIFLGYFPRLDNKFPAFPNVSPQHLEHLLGRVESYHLA